MARASILIAFLITAVGVGIVFTPFAVITPSENIVLPDDIAVCEAVLLAHFEQISPKGRKGIRYYFADRKTSDANDVVFPEIFFYKYRQHVPPFRKAIELSGWQPHDFWSRNYFSWSFKTRQVDQDTYEVLGGYFCGGLCAEYCTYRVVRKQGKWEIVETSGCIES